MSWDPEETTQSLEEDIATTTSAIRQTTKPTIDVSTASWDHTPMDTTTQSEYLGATGPSDEYEEGNSKIKHKTVCLLQVYHQNEVKEL